MNTINVKMTGDGVYEVGNGLYLWRVHESSGAVLYLIIETPDKCVGIKLTDDDYEDDVLKPSALDLDAAARTFIELPYGRNALVSREIPREDFAVTYSLFFNKTQTW